MSEVATRVSFKKTKRGKIRKIVREIYLRDDIPCGFSDCMQCSNQSHFPAASSCNALILDSAIVARQQDFLLSDEVFTQRNLAVFILRSSLGEDSGKISRKFVDSENFKVFPNDFFKPTFEPFPSVETPENMKTRSDAAVQKMHTWLTAHADLKSLRVLVETESRVEEFLALGVPAISLGRFCQENSAAYPLVGEKIAQPETDLTDGAIYPPHLSASEISEKIATGKLLSGTLRMFMGTSMRGSIHSGEIEISGRVALNRALDGDLVAVELVEATTQPDEEEADLMTIASEVGNRMLTSATQNKAGRIVGILKRNFREICGTLKTMPEGETNSNRLFIPADARLPFISINTKLSSQLEGQRILVVVDSWDRFSRSPTGHWTRVLGPAGDRDTESACILHEHSVVTREFSDAAMRCLPSSDFKPSAEEISRRLDLRSVCVCSIDPPGCKDIDDALSCEKLENGNFRIGVHIADVTYFVAPASPLDAEAAERCTTVYLVERRTDMLPSLLTTDLCSLRGGVDRLAFSVLWEVNAAGDIVDTTFHKTIIHSSAALTYAAAQGKIEDSSDRSELAESIRRLNNFAKIIRARRFGAGALELASQEVRFELDSETMDPTGVSAYESRDTNKLVEEFMLLANQAVAEQILCQFPSTSILRRHPPPKEASLEKLKNLLKAHGIEDFEFGSNLELARSLDKATRIGDPQFNRLVRIMTTRAMNQAVYFCTGEVEPGQFGHYGLAMGLYTHFTSPIRRYADVMAHRLLAASLGLFPVPEALGEKKLVQDQCEIINFRHRNAQFAGRASADLHTFLFFRKKGPLEAQGIVSNVKRNNQGAVNVTVTVPSFGVEGLMSLPVDWTFNEVAGSAESNGNHLSAFDHVKVKIYAEDKDFRFKTRFEFIDKTSATENAADVEKKRRAAEKEMFPDRLEERPSSI